MQDDSEPAAVLCLGLDKQSPAVFRVVLPPRRTVVIGDYRPANLVASQTPTLTQFGLDRR